MKVFAIFTVLLLATATQANFFQSVGNFFSGLLHNVGSDALNVLKNTGQQILKNATGTAANLLSETGQYALFELGNTLNSNQKRSLSSLFSNLLQSNINTALDKGQQVVTAAEQLAGKLNSNTAQNVLNAIPALKSAVSNIVSQFEQGVLSQVDSQLKGAIQAVASGANGGQAVAVSSSNGAQSSSSVSDSGSASSSAGGAQASASLNKRNSADLLNQVSQLIQPFASDLQQQLNGVVDKLQSLGQQVLSNGQGVNFLNNILG